MNATLETIARYDIPAQNLETLKASIEKLNRRAARLGCDVVTLEVGKAFEKEVKDPRGRRYTETLYPCVLLGELPRVDGWEFVAVLEPQDNGEVMVRTVGEQEIPAHYRETNMTCDHCQTKRQRSAVYLLKSEINGEFQQVGRNCLRDFLCVDDVDQYLWRMSLVQDASDECGNAEDIDAEGGYAPSSWSIYGFLGMVNCLIREFGWVPRSKSEHSSTADLAMRYCGNKPLQRKAKIKVEQSDYDQAVTVLNWAKELPTDTNSDFIYNLGVACRQDCVTTKTAGLVAASVQAYNREKQQQAEHEAIQAKSQHVGEPKQRLEFHNLTVMAKHHCESFYGPMEIIRFQDETGNVLVWFASGDTQWVPEITEQVSIKATIKKHDDYNGTAQTVLNRAVLLK